MGLRRGLPEGILWLFHQATVQGGRTSWGVSPHGRVWGHHHCASMANAAGQRGLGQRPWAVWRASGLEGRCGTGPCGQGWAAELQGTGDLRSHPPQGREMGPRGRKALGRTLDQRAGCDENHCGKGSLGGWQDPGVDARGGPTWGEGSWGGEDPSGKGHRGRQEGPGAGKTLGGGCGRTHPGRGARGGLTLAGARGGAGRARRGAPGRTRPGERAGPAAGPGRADGPPRQGRAEARGGPAG